MPLLNATDQDLLTDDGEAYEVPEEGSLGLLALGYQGIMAWRAKKLETRRASKTNPDVQET